MRGAAHGEAAAKPREPRQTDEVGLLRALRAYREQRKTSPKSANLHYHSCCGVLPSVKEIGERESRNLRSKLSQKRLDKILRLITDRLNGQPERLFDL